MTTFGVIGTGHLATYFVTALRRGGFAGRILLSPRNPKRAQQLERTHACAVAASNAAVVAAADIVLLSVRPQHTEAALGGLSWSSSQTALSAMAGIRLERLCSLLPGVGAVHLIMPVSYIEAVRGPIPLYPPAPDLMTFLGHAGEVVALDDERAFEASLLAACASTWIYDLAGVLAEELARHGLSPRSARLLALGSIAGPAGYGLARPDEALKDISASIATDRTYTKLGLELMREQAFDAPWRRALAAIAARLG